MSARFIKIVDAYGTLRLINVDQIMVIQAHNVAGYAGRAETKSMIIMTGASDTIVLTHTVDSVMEIINGGGE